MVFGLMIMNKEDRQLLSAQVAEAYRKGQLTDAQLNLIHQRKWFRMFVPKSHGGLQYSLPEALRLQEQLAKIDGSLGWTITLCSGAGWFAGFMEPKMATQIFATPGVCIAGSGAPTGRAEKTQSGYKVSGSWRFATGAPHATHFTTNCELWETNRPVLQPDGSTRIVSVVFLKEEVTINQNWRGMGLKATASHSFSVEALDIPEERLFDIGCPKLDLPIYRYPFQTFAETTLAVTFAGTALRFLELALAVFQDRKTTPALQNARTALNQVQRRLADFYADVDQHWQLFLDNPATPPPDLSKVCKTLTQTCYQQISGVYPDCGMEGADMNSPLNRCWRDLHTASQHVLVYI